MSTRSSTTGRSVSDSIVGFLTEYAVVVYPLLFGISLIALGWVLDATGRGAGAGVSAATGIILCGITVVVYLIFWALGRFGH